MARVNVTIGLDPDIKETLEAFAAQDGTTLSSMLSEMVETMLLADPCGRPDPLLRSYNTRKLKQRRDLSEVARSILEEAEKNLYEALDGEDKQYCEMLLINAIDDRFSDEALLKLRKIKDTGVDSAQLSQIWTVMKEAVLSEEQIDFLARQRLYPIQAEQVVLGFEHGLSIPQVATYAKRNISAAKMEKMRITFEKKRKSRK